MSTVWRSRTVAFALLLLTGRGPAAHSGGMASNDAPWSFHLEWEYDTASPSYFDLCVDSVCSPLAATRSSAQTWRAPLPAMPLGEHHLVVRACVGGECVPGTPDIVVRVLPPSARRPPIDIIDGPRIPLNHR